MCSTTIWIFKQSVGSRVWFSCSKLDINTYSIYCSVKAYDKPIADEYRCIVEFEQLIAMSVRLTWSRRDTKQLIDVSVLPSWSKRHTNSWLISLSSRVGAADHNMSVWLSWNRRHSKQLIDVSVLLSWRRRHTKQLIDVSVWLSCKQQLRRAVSAATSAPWSALLNCHGSACADSAN